MLTTIGLTIICFAWVYQLHLLTNKKDVLLSSKFVGIYVLGVLLLVVDGFTSTVTSVSWLNFFSFIISAGVLYMLWKK